VELVGVGTVVENSTKKKIFFKLIKREEAGEAASKVDEKIGSIPSLLGSVFSA
jgi:hypothetical protein